MKNWKKMTLLIVVMLAVMLACNLPTPMRQDVVRDVSLERSKSQDIQEAKIPETSIPLDKNKPGVLINPAETPGYLRPLDCDNPEGSYEIEACEGYSGVYDGTGTKTDAEGNFVSLSPPNNLAHTISLLKEEDYLNVLLHMIQVRDPRLGFKDCGDASIYGEVIPLSYLVNMGFVEDGSAAGVIISAEELDAHLRVFDLRYNSYIDVNMTEMELVALTGNSWLNRQIHICNWGEQDALIYGNVQDFFDTIAEYVAPPGLDG